MLKIIAQQDQRLSFQISFPNQEAKENSGIADADIDENQEIPLIQVRKRLEKKLNQLVNNGLEFQEFKLQMDRIKQSRFREMNATDMLQKNKKQASARLNIREI